MGLLDWLTGDIGGMGGGPSPGAMGSMGMDAMNMPKPMAPPPIPSMQAAAPQANPEMPSGAPLQGAMPSGSPMDGGSAMPALPPPINVPNRGAPDASMLPPNAMPAIGRDLPMPAAGGGPLSPEDAAGVGQSYMRAGGNLAPPADGANSGATTMLGRALGLDVNRERKLTGSLAAGLKAAGDSAGKSPFQALTSGAGSALEGGEKASDKTTAEQSRYINDAAKASAVGDAHALTIARTKLALSQAKAVDENRGGKGSKDSVLNTPEQLYLRGLGAVNQDARVKASAAALKGLAGPNGAMMDTPEYKAAQKAHDQLIDQTKGEVFKQLGVDGKTAASVSKKPGFSADTPMPAAGLTKQKFDELPEGAYFINPKDGRLLVKKGVADQPQPGTNQPPAIPAPPAIAAPAGSSYDSEE